jgi:hypothetical protein
VACQDKIVFEPLVTCAFIKSAREYVVVVLSTNILVKYQLSVQGVERNFLATTEHNVTRDIVYLATLNVSSISKLPNKL